jgi:hypothetical protein
MDRLRRAAVFVAVVSARFVKSEAAQRELAEFGKIVEKQARNHPPGRARIFKVMKSPVPKEKQPLALQSPLGYEFFMTDQDTGRVREFDEIWTRRDGLLARLDDLAHDMARVRKICAKTDSVVLRCLQTIR